MAWLVRVARESLSAEAWRALQAARPELLSNVLEGRSIAWEEVERAEYPQFGGGSAWQQRRRQ
jgi:hypothetical protein